MATESAVVSVVGGTCSGLVCTVLFQPLDFLKTQLQLNRIKSIRGLSGELVTRSGLYEGIIKRAWWVGLQPSLAKTIPGVACYFLTLSQLRRIHGEDLSPLSAVIIGALARSLTVMFVQPLTLIKTRYESGKFGYTTIRGAVTDIVAAERMRGLYRGLMATIIRDAPFSGLYLAFYTHMKSNVFHGSGSVRSTTVSGLCAGSLAALITHPADVIKTRVQTQGAGQRTSVPQTILLLYNEQGIISFYSGFAPRVVRRTLVSSTAWLVYEEVKKRSHLFNL